MITSKRSSVVATKRMPSSITRFSRGSSKAPWEWLGRNSLHMSTTVPSISTMVIRSTLLCLATSRSMPPSPPPMINTRRAAPWARIGTWVSISW